MNWLGKRKEKKRGKGKKDNVPCILLVDELNNLNVDRNCARFLKDVFLKDEGSFLVFTSHRVSLVSDLDEYMQGSEESSHCGIMLRELPLVPSLGEAETLKQGISPMGTLFFDLVPALIVQDEKRIPPSVTVRRVTAKWVREGKVDDDERMRDVLNTFLTGRGELKGSPLLQFMSAFSDLRQERYLIRWIPSLMSVALGGNNGESRIQLHFSFLVGNNC